VNPADIKLFYQPKDRLRMTVGETSSYPTVKPAWAAPLSRPDAYLSLLDGKGEEITTVSDPNTLPGESLESVKEELRRRYLTATIDEIKSAKFEYGTTY